MTYFLIQENSSVFLWNDKTIAFYGKSLLYAYLIIEIFSLKRRLLIPTSISSQGW